MKTFVLATLSISMTLSPSFQVRFTEHGVIDYAKSVDVKMLDPSLPSQRLEDWLQTGPPHARVEWTLADSCDNKPDGNVDYPLCAKVWFKRNGEAGSLLIQVGTRRKGITGRPQLYNPILSWEDGPGWIMTGDSEQLSGLPALLDEPAYAQSVGLLYSEIVMRHPIGIPTGAGFAAIRPDLSNRLAERLRVAKGCEADYFRQHLSTTEGTPKPTWLKSGLFTGQGSRVLPLSAWPVRKGAQEDGSFLVMVNLFAQTIDVGTGLKGGAYSPSGNWHVYVRVVPEDGRYVVDDVRLFDGPSTDGPSHLLSDEFVGCDGSRWNGSTVTKR